MDIKQYISLEVKKDANTFVFYIPSGCTWGMAIDAAYEVLQEVNKMSLQAIERESALKKAEEQNGTV